MYENHKICIVIPAFNEEAKIGDVLDKIPPYVDTVVVVNDGSTDKTQEIARSKGAIVATHKENMGVGAAFNTGVRKTLELDVDIMANIDADGQFNPEDIEKLVRPIVEGKADFVTASRFKDPTLYPKMSRIKFLGNKFMSYFVSKIIREKFYDVSCGFRAYSREALLRMNLFGDFTYTQETFIDLAFKNLRILEVPVKVRGTRQVGKSKVASNLFRYGSQTLKIILKTLRDYKPLRLFAFISAVCFILGTGFGAFLLTHYILSGEFSPHKWAGFISGFLIIFAVIWLIFGFILDMFARMRQNQEKILYMLKKVQKED